MRSYNEFILEKQIQLIAESILYLSPKLREDLSKVMHPIARDLLNAEGSDRKEDVTFLDSDSREGYVTFKTMKSMLKGIEEEAPLVYIADLIPILKKVETGYKGSYSDTYLMSLPSWNKARNPIKLGKLVNTILPGKYNSSEIEEFTNKFKSVQKGETSATIKVVEGSEIIKWYDGRNYLELNSSLGNSCMRYEKCSTYFEIYTENPEVCKMVCLLEEDENKEIKLRARAILWKVEKKYKSSNDLEFEWFMDRQYAISDADIQFLKEWAESQGYAYKTNNSFGSLEGVTYNGSDSRIKMKVRLKEKNYRRFPYLDTFKRFDPDECVLYNDESRDYEGQYLLNSTSGGYEEITAGVWSEWHGENIPEEDAVYSDAVESYIWESDAVYVGSGSQEYRGWYPSDYADLVPDEWIHEVIHANDAIWSDYYEGYVLMDETILVVDEISEDGEPLGEDCYVYPQDTRACVRTKEYSSEIWYKILSNLHPEWLEYSGILKSLLTDNYKSDWIIYDYKVTTYMLTDEELSKYPRKIIFGLTEKDAQELNIQIDKKEPRQEDLFGYYNYILVNVPELAVNLEEAVMKKGDEKEKKVFEMVKDYLEN